MRPRELGGSDSATPLSDRLVTAARPSLQTDIYDFPLEPEKGAAEAPCCEATTGGFILGREAPACRLPPLSWLLHGLPRTLLLSARSPPESVSQGAVTVSWTLPGSTSRCNMWGARKAPWRQGSQTSGCAPQKGDGPLIAWMGS